MGLRSSDARDKKRALGKQINKPGMQDAYHDGDGACHLMLQDAPEACIDGSNTASTLPGVTCYTVTANSGVSHGRIPCSAGTKPAARFSSLLSLC
jgi:hypothetical protein